VKIRSYLSKIKFDLGLNPIVKSNAEQPENYIPEEFKAVCLISADLELAWAFRFSKNHKDSIPRAVKLGLQTRQNLTKILKICEENNIPITWATVGHLFLNKCDRVGGVTHPDILRLPKFENRYWNFNDGDWFDADPCSNWQVDPAWYCPDLIEQIIKSPIGHEIGCHTFSHIDCRDSVCNTEVFKSEIEKCIDLAKPFNLKLTSFVHPGHQIGHIKELAEYGFTSYRTDYSNCLGYPQRVSGMWQYNNSAELNYRFDWSLEFQINRYKKIIDRAIKHKKLCVLWFHPSANPILADKILPEIFNYLYSKKKDILITTSGQYFSWLNAKK
jgi:peptidoglycan/xylan/chitin deacetylase (PgdA/CDA1 family)